MTPGRALVVMAKAPVGGSAKTRLAASARLDPAAIQALVEAFLLDTLEHAREVPAADVRVCFAPASQRAWFESRVDGLDLSPQVEGDLGARMTAVFDAEFQRGVRAVVIIGSDTPHLPTERISQAFRELDNHDVVLGPALDGGYYVIGLSAPAVTLFDDVPWSTDRVLDVTLQRARSARLSVSRLEPTYDVDGAPDLERLAAEIAADRAYCPRCARVLRELRRL